MTDTQIPIIGWERRYMTARECARLQSMNDIKELPKGLAAFKALGNAVNVTVVEKILNQLLPLQRSERRLRVNGAKRNAVSNRKSAKSSRSGSGYRLAA
jgi:DNA (cytosine-5)-methyltransferase 1